MNKARNTLTTAALLALAIIVSAAVLLGITYQLSQNATISSTVFFGTFLANLVSVLWWATRQLAPAAQRRRMSVHRFIAHMNMHPGRMPAGMTELDLERFRKLHGGSGQARLDAWIGQFRGGTKAARPSSQFR